MNARHTPGPWAINIQEWVSGEKNYYVEDEGSDNSICKVFQKPLERETSANAKLIAAAPDLLEALLDCVSDYPNISQATIDFAKKAIAKATT